MSTDQRDRTLDVSNSNGVVVLKHPNGNMIYLVGTAHVGSEEASKDVESTISKVSPAVVVVELDQGRYQRLLQAVESGDAYGLSQLKGRNSAFKIITMAINGEVLPYTMSLMYVITGALMGTRPGGEFLVAADAARQVGAEVVMADRDQSVTMKRLAWYSRQIQRSNARDRAAGGTFPSPESQDDEGRMPGSPPKFMKPPGDANNSSTSEGDLASPDSQSDRIDSKSDGPWGLEGNEEESELDTGTGANQQEALKRRFLNMMREGGCERPEDVLKAAQRLIKTGLDPKKVISSQDIGTVRGCGRKLIETFRRKAIQGDEGWIQKLETETIGGAKGAAGMQRSGAAMRKVIIEERDLILARKLYEAGLQAGDNQPVVGVVGAGHITGIQRVWTFASTPTAGERVNEYLALPPGESGPSAVGSLATTAAIAFMAWRRPKVAKVAGFIVGGAALMTAPYLGFTVFSVKRLNGFAQKLCRTCESLEVSSGMDEGWPEDDIEQASGSNWQ